MRRSSSKELGSLTPPTSPSYSTSFRYSSEFKELDILGQGAYGEVFKVENKLDGCTYAIKKVKLEDDESVNRIILREVSALSRLTHKYIVRYYQSWIEAGWTFNNLLPQITVDPPTQESPKPNDEFDFQIPTLSSSPKRKSSLEDDDSSMEGLQFDYTDQPEAPQEMVVPEKPKREKKKQLVKVDSKEETSILNCNFCNANYFDWEVSFEDWKLLETRFQPLNLCEKCFEDQLKKQPNTYFENVHIRRKTPGPSYLYIQIQYCDHTLRELMDDHSLWLIWKEDDIWFLVRQIAEALEYLHKQKYIHRDLKPSNIFLLNGSIKLGDFGLATCSVEHEISMESLLCDATKYSEKTYNVGTYLYSSPDIKTKIYTEKVDMYSLGIIVFELWQPFKTTMERCKNIETLRDKKILPDSFREKCPKQADLVHRLVQDNPEKRPSSSDVVKEIPTKRSKSVRGFGVHLARVSMENARLIEENYQLTEKVRQLEEKVKTLEDQNLFLKQNLPL